MEGTVVYRDGFISKPQETAGVCVCVCGGVVVGEKII